MQPEKLPQSAFKQVALNGPPNFPADCQPEPGRAVRFLHDNDDKMTSMPFTTLSLNHQICPPVAHSAGRGKRPLRYHRLADNLFGRDRDDQALAPLGPATLEDDLAVFALHPTTKAMGSFTANFTWLISAFHVLTNSL